MAAVLGDLAQLKIDRLKPPPIGLGDYAEPVQPRIPQRQPPATDVKSSSDAVITKWSTGVAMPVFRIDVFQGTRMARPRTRPASRSSNARWNSSRGYLLACNETLPCAARIISSCRSL